MREISAGGVVVRKQDSVWWMAAIELPVAAKAVSDPGKSSVRNRPSEVLMRRDNLVIGPGKERRHARRRESRRRSAGSNRIGHNHGWKLIR